MGGPKGGTGDPGRAGEPGLPGARVSSSVSGVHHHHHHHNQPKQSSIRAGAHRGFKSVSIYMYNVDTVIVCDAHRVSLVALEMLVLKAKLVLV